METVGGNRRDRQCDRGRGEVDPRLVISTSRIPAALAKLVEMTPSRGRGFAIEFCDTVVSRIPDDPVPITSVAETTGSEKRASRGWGRSGRDGCGKRSVPRTWAVGSPRKCGCFHYGAGNGSRQGLESPLSGAQIDSRSTGDTRGTEMEAKLINGTPISKIEQSADERIQFMLRLGACLAGMLMPSSNCLSSDIRRRQL